MRRAFALPFFGKCVGVRYNSSEDMELYGRAIISEGIASPLANRVVQETVTRSALGEAVEEFEAQAYAHPQAIPTEAREKVLQTSSALMLSHARCLREHQDVWQEALRVYHHPACPPPQWQDHYRIGVTLLQNEQYERCLQLTRRCLNLPISSEGEGIRHMLLLMAVHCLAAWKEEEAVKSTEWDRIGAALKAVGEGPRDPPLLHAAEVLWWTVDWLFHEGVVSSEGSVISALRRLLPPSLAAVLLREEEVSVTARLHGNHRVLQALSPWHVYHYLSKSPQEHTQQTLVLLLQAMQREEERRLPFRMFHLAAMAGSCLLRLSPQHAIQADVLEAMGSTLDPSAIAASGNTRQGYTAAVALLSQMSGPLTYEALRSVTWHQPVDVRRQIQEDHGDVLSLNGPRDWKAALLALTASLQTDMTQWRSNLPNTLRLLSDAGRHSEFFELVAQYDPQHRPADNVTVAAALGHTMRCTGSWWYALEVLDLIASSPPPQNITDDVMLRDACLQVTHTLRTSRQWSACLSFFKALRPVMPPQAHRWMLSVIVDMPSAAPWAEALAMLSGQSKASNLPEQFKAALRCVHCEDYFPSDSHSRRYVIRSLIHHGKWEYLLSLASIGAGGGDGGASLPSWRQVMQAAHRSERPVNEAFFEAMRVEHLSTPEDIRLAFIIAYESGLLHRIREKLSESMTSASTAADDAREWLLLTELLLGMDGADRAIEESAVPFRQLGVVLRVLHAVTRHRLRLTCMWDGQREALARRLSLPAPCVRERKKRKRYHQSETTGASFRVASSPGLSVTENLIVCDCDGEVIVAEKPFGAESAEFARGVVSQLRLDTTFMLPFTSPPDSAGVLVLLAATVPLKSVSLRVVIRCVLAPLVSSSSQKVEDEGEEGGGAAAKPLLSCSFFELYRMRVLAAKSVSCVSVECICETSASQAHLALLRWKQNMAAEGWGVHRDGDDDSTQPAKALSDDAMFIISSVAVSYVNRKGDAIHVQGGH